jgi:hypothetical protein
VLKPIADANDMDLPLSEAASRVGLEIPANSRSSSAAET